MSLITSTWIKPRFPIWRDFCDIEDFAQTPDEMLDIAIETGEDEFLGYITVEDGDAEFTDVLKLQLLRIVKKHCFDFQHSADLFENRPQILKDYDNAIAMLEKYRAGDLPSAPQVGGNADSVTMTAKDREFDEWFSDHANDLTESED